MHDIWNEFLKIVSQEAGSRVVETWLKAVSLNKWDSLQKTIYFQAPNVFVKEWIKSHYMDLFHIHLSRLLNVESLKVVFLEAQAATESLRNTALAIIPARQAVDLTTTNTELVKRSSKSRCVINKNYQFDTFVVGPSNSLAYSAAHAITDKPGVLYNPLFIYGGSGLGKTHLLHAIGNEMRNKNRKLEILYQTTDRFVTEFINAIRFDKVHQFQEKYKKVDVFLVDDVQFISNKEQTQEAFFHIFNSLYESHKQLVFSSDLYPADIKGLAERLSSRFEWGLVTDIQMPTTETKIAILKHKADLHNECLPDEVAHFIAARVLSNVRELEGSLIRIMAYAALTKQHITIELAKKILVRTQDVQVKFIDFDRIIKVICSYYPHTITDLRSESRNKQLSLVRQITMYVMKTMTNKSLHEIGHFLGRKDHTTVLHALQKIKARIQNDPSFAAHMKKIEEDILGQ